MTAKKPLSWMGHPRSWSVRFRDARLRQKMAYCFPSSVRMVVPPVAFAVGGGLVGLLDVAEHLVVELVAQGGEVGGDGFGVGVFGVEVGGDFGVFLVAEPGVVVGEGDAVEDGFLVVFAGDGGRGIGRSVMAGSSVEEAGT